MTTEDSAENLPDVRNIAEPDCPICHGNGVYCIGTSGSYEDGNCPILEGCDCVTKYYSQAGLDRRVADLEHRLKCSEILRQELVKEIEQLTSEVAGLRIRKFTHFNNEECWIYDPNGENNLDSLVCPVVISPSDLQNVVMGAEERQREKDADICEKRANKQFRSWGWNTEEAYACANAILNAGGKGDE